MQQTYTPSEKTLEKYAELIVMFGMQNNAGTPLKKGGVIQFIVPEVAKPLYIHLQRAILKNGYQPLGTFTPSVDDQYNDQADFFKYANKKQREFYLEKYTRGTIDQIDGVIHVIAPTDPQELSSVNPKHILERTQALKKGIAYRKKKIDDEKLNWTIVLYGTDAMAAEAGLSPKQYWNQIIKACYLNEKNPVTTWKHINKTVQSTAKKLTDLKIQEVHVSGVDMDLTLGFGKRTKWLAGGGCNIPSYEVFTVPAWQTVNGWARLNQPHYRYGQKIEGIELWFKDGIVVKSKATKNHDLLKQMLKAPGGNKLGEFSLTDRRLSKITKFMAEILYDENTGGRYGNTHIALGASFRECYTGKKDPAWKNADWDKLGFNNSSLHSDVISTTNRTVTAKLYDGRELVIYRDGEFTI